MLRVGRADRVTGALALGACGLLVLEMPRGGGDGPLKPMPVAPAAAVHADGAPPGHTGGFGEPTCRTCHAEHDLNVDGRLEVEGLPERYEPGRTYAVTLVLESDGMERAGFQAAFRYADGDLEGRSAGRPSITAEDVVATQPGDGVIYFGHAPGGTWTGGDRPVGVWSFGWTAPEIPAGPVAFHAAANSADGDDSPFGDLVYTVADTVEGPTGSG